MPYAGKTKAFKRFNQHYWRTEILLDAGLSGLEENRKPLEGILKKLSNVKGPRGKIPEDYTPSIKSTKNKENDGVSLALDVRSAAFLKKTCELHLDAHKQLQYHHFSILSVSIWGSYETYVYMLFEELFAKQPLMIRTNEYITYCDALDNKKDIRSYLAQKSLEKIGHFTLKESLSYLNEKINFKYTARRATSLNHIYLIRNIIAHNSGVLRHGQEKLLPSGVSVKARELRISKAYLKRIHSTIKASVTLLEKHVETKFYKKK